MCRQGIGLGDLSITKNKNWENLSRIKYCFILHVQENVCMVFFLLFAFGRNTDFCMSDSE